MILPHNIFKNLRSTLSGQNKITHVILLKRKTLDFLSVTTTFFAQMLVSTQVDKPKDNGERIGEIILSEPLALSPHCSLLSPCGFATLGYDFVIKKIARFPRSTQRKLLPLLPSGPDGVHNPLLHGTRLSKS